MLLGCVGERPARRRGKPRNSAGVPTEVGREDTFTPPASSLRQAAEAKGKLVGAALAADLLGRPAYARAAAFDFNYLTPENDTKWQNTEPAPGQFTFERGDRLMAFAREHNMKVKGHTLVWHQALPAWVERLDESGLREALRSHVKEVAAHFRGQVYAWDVVNEAIADGGRGHRSDSVFLQKLGPVYIEEAFRAAHAADPEALLFYNDYDAEAVGLPKSEAVYRLVKDLVDKGVPISGVGLQMHVDPRSLGRTEAALEKRLAAIAANMQRLAALGLKVNLSELDVPVGAIPGDRQTKWQRQAQLYEAFVGLCVEQAACDAVTLWGFVDSHTWLNMPEFARYRGKMPHEPLLYTANYEAKPARDGVMRALTR